MRNRLIITLLTLIVLFSCSKDNKVQCPINYQIVNGTYIIGRTWKLVGFQNEASSNIDYPPCEAYNGQSNFEMTISFADTLSNLHDTIWFHKYPYLFKAKSTISSFYGSYKIDSLNVLIMSPIFCIFKPGEQVLMDYETKYYNALENAKRFVIEKNMLTIYYNQTDKILFVAKD